MIHYSPLSIYNFVLQLCPSSSWLCEYYNAELLQEVRVVTGALTEWGTCSRTISLGSMPMSLACQNGTFAVGLESGGITILDVITGSQVAVLSGHTDWVRSLTFSLDGTFLVSGSDDKTVKLWDVQTSGVVKTFHGHAGWVRSVSISPDCATIASGSEDKTIHLWHVQVGDCFCVIGGFRGVVYSVSFSPTNPQLLISACADNTVQQWGIDGCQIGPTHQGKGVVFSSDGTHFVSWGGQVATVQSFNSRLVIAELQVSSGSFQCCCFSSNGKSVAGGVNLNFGSTIYIWDITGSDPHLIETLTGHSNIFTYLIFPSSLISASSDSTIKFWQISTKSTDLLAANTVSTPSIPSYIQSVSLQVRDGVAISSDEAGMVKTWDIFTGLCKAAIQTPAEGNSWRDVQLIEGRLIVVWHGHQKIWIWDGEKGEFLQMVDTPFEYARGVRISGDGSKVFCLARGSIQAWSIWTGELMGKVKLKHDAYFDPLYMDGSKIWVCFKDSSTQGWDFGISGSSPIPLSNTFPDRPHLDFHGNRWGTSPSMIKDTVTGKEVFRLVGRYAKFDEGQWDGWYLVAGYGPGEVLILDFNHVLLQ